MLLLLPRPAAAAAVDVALLCARYAILHTLCRHPTAADDFTPPSSLPSKPIPQQYDNDDARNCDHKQHLGSVCGDVTSSSVIDDASCCTLERRRWHGCCCSTLSCARYRTITHDITRLFGDLSSSTFYCEGFCSFLFRKTRLRRNEN